MLNDSHSPRSQAEQLEVLAEAGFALATRPSGKEQDSKADGEVKKSTFPSVLLLHRDLYNGIFAEKNMNFLSEAILPSLTSCCPKHSKESVGKICLQTGNATLFHTALH